MTPTTIRPPVPRIMLTIQEAAGACGLSENQFRDVVLPHVRTVRVGERTVRIPVEELRRYAQERAALTDPRGAR